MKFTGTRSLFRTANLHRGLCISVGGLFVYAGLIKAMDIQGFLATIMGYQLTGPFSSKVIACGLPYIEILSGGLLIIGIKEKEVLIIITVLTCLFTGVIWYAMHIKLQIPCGCFAQGKPPGNLMLLITRNLCIIIVCLYNLTKKGWIYTHERV